MYDYHVGIVAEGVTDVIMIEKIIQTVWNDRHLIFTTLSPTAKEITHEVEKREGFGWRSVYEVCHEISDRLEIQRAAGVSFDCVVVHLDGDVGASTFQNANINNPVDPNELPCFTKGKSVKENCEVLEHIVEKWLGNTFGVGRAFCVPYINSDLWVAFCAYPEFRKNMFEGWEVDSLNKFLLMMPKSSGRLIRKKDGRIRKKTKEYRYSVENIDESVWACLCDSFVQANRFDEELHRV